MSRNTFWILQFVVGVVVAIAVLNTPSLNKALMGDAGGIPEWLTLKNLKVQFI